MTSEATEGQFRYDLFVLHADAPGDKAFVDGYLLPNLGLTADRVHRRQTAELGRGILEEIERGIQTSRVTVAVLSTAYMDDHVAAFGAQLATWASVAASEHGTLIPLVLEDCKLTMYVQSRVALDFRDRSRESWAAQIERLQRHVDRLADRTTTAEPEAVTCPYPGMRPFSESDAAQFFGRDAEIDELQYMLRHGAREIYVIGPSGSGKSSLIAAGLVPRLPRHSDGSPHFHVASLRPGECPAERLAEVLDGDVIAPAAAIERLLTLHAPATSLLLIIDQLEELFAIAGETQRRDFYAAVRALRNDPRCVLLFGLRADFYGEFMTSPLWAEARISRIDLRPIGRDGLQKIIELPAHNAGVYLEPQLVSRLLDDAAREPGVLPLLQETLFQLWDRRRQYLLTLADYQALGDGTRTGLAFAVERHADFVLGRLASQDQAIAFRIFLRLVSFGEGRADTRRQQPRGALRSADETATCFDAVLTHLVNQRLVTVTGDDQHGDARVDLAHEMLIEAWSTLTEWIQTWRIQEQHRRKFEAVAAAWHAAGSGNEELLGPTQLAEAIAWRTNAANKLGHSAQLGALLVASEDAQSRASQQHRRARRLRTALGTAIVAAMSILLFVASRSAHEADEQRAHADLEHRTAEQHRRDKERLGAISSQLYQEKAVRFIDAELPLQAIPYLIASAETNGDKPNSALQMLFAAATRILPTQPLQHDAALRRAAFSPDGTRVVTASRDGTARVWDTRSGEQRTVVEHEAAVLDAAFSPDGARIATCSEDGTARIWNAATGKPLVRALPHENFVMTTRFSPSGTLLATASLDGTARIWDAKTGALVQTLAHRTAVWSVAWSPDNTRLATAGRDVVARIWDSRTGAQLWTLAHRHAVWKVTWSPDGTRLATASQDGTAQIWNVRTGRALTTPLKHGDGVAVAAFDPSGEFLVTASHDQTARVWNAVTGEPVTRPLPHLGSVTAAAFSPDGARVVTASRDDTARIWDARTGRALRPVLEHTAAVLTAEFSPDGSRLATASEDGTARVWNVTIDPPAVPLAFDGVVRSAVFSPDDAYVATGSDDNIVRIWNTTTGSLTGRVLVHDAALRSIGFSSDGTRVVTAAKRTVRIWDVANGSSLAVFPHPEIVTSASFSRDGRRIVAIMGNDERRSNDVLRIWDITGASISVSLDLRDRVVNTWLSNDGSHLVALTNDRVARICDATTGRVTTDLPDKMDVTAVAFSMDGKRVVATGGNGGAARVWDVATGNAVGPPLESDERVKLASFAPDGDRIVTVSDSGSTRIWSASTGEPLSRPYFQDTPIVAAAFSADGARLFTVDSHAVRTWNVALDRRSRQEWSKIAAKQPYILENGTLMLRSKLVARPVRAQTAIDSSRSSDYGQVLHDETKPKRSAKPGQIKGAASGH